MLSYGYNNVSLESACLFFFHIYTQEQLHRVDNLTKTYSSRYGFHGIQFSINTCI